VQILAVEDQRVEILAAKQAVAHYKGAKLIFEPALEGWVQRAHVVRSTTADLAKSE